MLISTDYLSLLQITQWVSRPAVSAAWVVVQNMVILFETQSRLGNLSLQEKELFGAILKAFSFPEDAPEKVQPFKLEAGVAQFKSAPAILWVWGEDLGKRLLRLHADAYPCSISVGPSLRNLLKDPIHKHKLWNDGRFILKNLKPIPLPPQKEGRG